MGRIDSIAGAISMTPEVCRRGLSPRCEDGPDLDVPIAYHVDAGRLAGFLRDAAKARGVKHQVDGVVHVECSGADHIERLMLASGATLEADLFIDCTGFRGMLINQALQRPFRHLSPHLLCDAAVAIGTDVNPKEGLAPYTRASALSSGWSWQVPLMQRRGCGYVYSSAHLDSEQAERELRAHLGTASDGKPAHHLSMRVGFTPQAWFGNCVAVGLSGGFIEPLEATGIFLVEYALATLLTLIPSQRPHPARAAQFNSIMEDAFEQVLDFVVMHYSLAGRRDTPFLARRLRPNQSAGDPRPAARVPQVAARNRCLGRNALSRPIATHAFLTVWGTCRPPHLLEQLGYGPGIDALGAIQRRQRQVVEQLPDHYSYLSRMASRPRG